MSGAGPSLFPGEVPAWSVLRFPPDAAPPPITNPYSGEPTLANPFQIPQDIFEKALDPKVPLTIAAIYAASVTYLNWYNRQHGNKPWRIASHGWFKAFVIAHNVFLAVYSAWTFLGTAPQVLGHFWSAFAEYGVAGLTHAFCDSSFAIWSSESFSKFAYLFYLSKFYVRSPVL